MFPREHGAYGQLLFPIVTALAVGRPGVSALALSVAAVCAFLAHEPLLVLLGQRGVQAARERRGEALRWFGAFAVAGAGLGAVAIASMHRPARLALVMSAALAAVLALTIFSKRERTAGGEILSAVTLSSMALPVALAAGASHEAALTCTLVYAASLSVGIVGVRAVIMHTRRPPAVASRVLAVVTALAVPSALAGLQSVGIVSAIAPWAALPLSIAGTVLAANPPSARRLRVVGWMLVAATASTMIVLVAGLR